MMVSGELGPRDFEFRSARDRYEEYVDAVWNLTRALVILEDELAVAKAALLVIEGASRLDPEVTGGKNEKERDALAMIVSRRSEPWLEATGRLRGLTVDIANKRADIEREEYLIRSWRLTLTFLASPREVP